MGNQVSTSAGIQLYIGPVYNDKIVETEAGITAATTALAALTYTAVGEVEDAGEIGDTVSTQTFTALDDRRTRKFKTTYDAGDQSLTIGLDQDDAGQIAMSAALKADDSYAFKIDYGDGFIDYYTGKVTKWSKSIGAADSITKRSATISIDSVVIEVVPE